MTNTVKLTKEAAVALQSAHQKTKVPKTWIASCAILRFVGKGKKQ